jgi:membrane protein DedA with SNARE-associated domain
MSFIEQAILLFANYPEAISFIGAYIGGIETLLLLGMLAGHGIISFSTAFIFSFIGYFIFELSVFFVARSKLMNRIKKWKWFEKKYIRIVHALKKSTVESDFLALVLAKFLYGIAIIILIYLSRERLTTKKFLIYNIPITFCSTLFIMSIGWLAGRGIRNITTLFNDVRLALTLFVIFLIIAHFAQEWISEFVEKKEKIKIKN